MRSSRHASRGTVAALRAAASLSLMAAMHLWAVPDHLEEWWGYGAFFLVLAVAQGLYALGLLRWRPSRPYFLLGVAGNLAVAILWLVTRTTGIPLLGPHAGEVERVGVLDLACTVAEVGIVAGLGALAIRDLPTEGRIQVVVVAAATSLLFWHLLHLLAGSSSH